MLSNNFPMLVANSHRITNWNSLDTLSSQKTLFRNVPVSHRHSSRGPERVKMQFRLLGLISAAIINHRYINMPNSQFLLSKRTILFQNTFEQFKVHHDVIKIYFSAITQYAFAFVFHRSENKIKVIEIFLNTHPTQCQRTQTTTIVK